MPSGLYQRNFQCIQNRWPQFAAQMDIAHPGVELILREDGFYSAKCHFQSNAYTLSPQKEMAVQLYSFRQEVRKTLEDGADLLFVLGIGLGENLKALWETIQSCQRGYAVVLEESVSILSAACHCSDLRDVFLSASCELVVAAALKEELCRRIHENSWFGARKSVFFWGYQVQETGMQPSYDSLMNEMNLYMAEEQMKFMDAWKEWVQRKAAGRNSSRIIACISEELHDDVIQMQSALSRNKKDHFKKIVIPQNKFISQTYLMQQIMETNADELIWYQIPPGKWLPESVWNSLPVLSTFLE